MGQVHCWIWEVGPGVLYTRSSNWWITARSFFLAKNLGRHEDNITHHVKWHIYIYINIYWPFMRNSPAQVNEFPSQRPVTRNFDVFFDLRLNKRLNKLWSRRWFETPLHSSWRHCNAWISNYIHYKVWYEITYPFPNLNDAAVEVWGWISNFVYWTYDNFFIPELKLKSYCSVEGY